MSRLTRGWLALLVALVVAAVSVPMLAPAALSGDGLEIAGNVVRGGVLHAPGFALQAWLQRLLAHLPGFSGDVDGTLRVDLLCLCAHAAAAAFLVEALRALGARPAARVAGALTFAFFPTTWPLGLEPEVFALAHMLMAAILWQCALLWSPRSAALDERRRIGQAALLGALVALAGAQHPVTIVTAPAFLGSFVAVVLRRRATATTATRANGSRSRIAWAALAVAAAVFAVVFCALVFTMPLLHGGAGFPDAPVFSAGDVVDHVLRRRYGTFRLGADAGASGTSALAVLGRFSLRAPLTPLLMAAGAVVVALRRRAPRSRDAGGEAQPLDEGSPAALLVVAVAALALLFLTRATLPGAATPYLERFGGTLLVPGAVLAGLALDFAAGPAGAPRARVAGAAALAALATVWLFVVGHARADLSDRNEQDVMRRALAAVLPDDAVWLAATDREVLGGAGEGDARRYPLNVHDGTAWYWRDVAPKLEPRLAFTGAPPSARDVVARARARGLFVAALDRALIDPDDAAAHLRGLLWVVDGADSGDVDVKTVDAALRLCPFVDELHARPLDAPGFGHATELAFARGFDGAATFLRAVNDPRAAAAARVARALERGVDERGWREGCAALLVPPP